MGICYVKSMNVNPSIPLRVKRGLDYRHKRTHKELRKGENYGENYRN